MNRAWLTLSLLLALAPPAAAEAVPKGLRVFVCGHSFHTMIAEPLSEVAKSAGIEGHQLVGKQFLGGSRTRQHWDLPDNRNDARMKLQAGAVDVLTVSPNAQIPDEGIDWFTDLALQHNPAARVLVQVSWYPWDSPANDRATFRNEDRDRADPAALRAAGRPFLDTLTKQVSELNDRLRPAASRDVVAMVPVGQAVLSLREKIVAGEAPGLTRQSQLFHDSIGHANTPITLLNTYCHYAVIYGRTPVGLSTPKAILQSVSAKDADGLNRLLQELAWQAVETEPLSGVKSRLKD